MAHWQKGTIVSGQPGGRVNVDPAGTDELRFLSPKFVMNDGGDYGVVGYGLDVVDRADFVTMPAWKANGTVGAATSGTTVSCPVATNSVGDILIAQLICRGSTTAFSMPAGWTEITQFTVDTHRVGLFWRRATASESAPTVTNAGRTSTNLLAAQMSSWSGCKTTGTPYEAVATASSASGVMNGAAVTTTGARRLATQFWVRGANSASAPDGEWTERLDQGTGGGGACRFMIDSATAEYAATIPACSRAGTGQLYGMIGLALIGAGTDQAATPNTLRRGLWVWDTATVLGDLDEENILLNEAVNSGVTDLYLYSPLPYFGTYATEMRAFIARAGQIGIRCWGLDGYRSWFSDGDGPARLYETIDAAIAFNAGGTASQRLAGFHIDQEPADLTVDDIPFTTFHNGVKSSSLSTTPASGVWKDTEALDREYLMRDWIEQHVECRARLNAAGYLLGTALPTWFDDYFGEPVTCTYGGVTQNVFLHLSANADDIVIMNYSTNPLNQIGRISGELAMSLAPMATAIEAHTGPGSGVSYGDTTGKQSKAAALADLATVRARYANYPRFKGDAIHDWVGWKALSPASTDTSNPLA